MEILTDVMHWEGFFASLAQISGTLVGLVFVALTFKPKTFMKGGDQLLTVLARQVFADFLSLLLISMLMLSPLPRESFVATIILAVVSLGLLRIVRELVALRHHLKRWTIMQRLVLSLAGNALLILWAIQLFAADPDTASGYMLLGGSILLLTSGCRSAWLLVVHEKSSLSA
ncbi:MAG TPA: hypothetical protein VK064_07295 [Wenzhouxiangella sp.]|nr:hypothetical protein [Wenzhouxiangella sp.]